MENNHIPVLVEEVLINLTPKDNEIYVDCTFGAGGYSKKILAAANCNVIGIDRDPDVANTSAKNFTELYQNRFKFIQGNFGDIKELLNQNNIEKVDAIILDLGVSSMQLDQAERGFSFSKLAKLDMRMSKEGVSAYDFVNNEKESVIADVLYKFGDEKFSRKIASKIVYRRAQKAIETTLELADIIRSVMPGKFKGHKTDPATKSFQAIRIWVNDEMGELERVLNSAIDLLNIGGRIVVVTFHSTEDRIVKTFFNDKSCKNKFVSRYLPEIITEGECVLKILNRKVIVASEDELHKNVRSRSAKLRAAVRV